jgi:hypothetical protein
MAIKDTRRRRSPYAAPEGRIESPEEEYARLENKNQQIRAKLAYQRSEDEFRPIRQAYEREHFDPDQVDEEFEFEEPAVAQVGPTAEEAAEEEAELESGQYKIPGMAPAAAAVAMRAQAPRLTEEADAQLLKDFGPTDKAEPAPTEVSREDTFRGAGNYTYAKTADGDWFFTSPSGKTGVAKKGSKAWQSITSESEGKGSLYGTEGFAGAESDPSKGTMTVLQGSALADDAESEILKLAEGGPELKYSKINLDVPEGGDLITMTGTVKSQEGLDLLKERMEDLYGPQVDLSEVKIEGGADEDAPGEPAPAERLSASDVRGDFSFNNPPPVFSPKKMALFLDQNPYIAQDPERLRAFIDDANYGDRRAAAQAFVDTIRAKEEMVSLARKSENLSADEALRLNELRLVFGKPRSFTDRTLAAALGAVTSPLRPGDSPGQGAVRGFLGPDPQAAVAKSVGATKKGEAGEDFGALLEAEFASR